ncbi:MAG: hypothetical protein HYR56_27735 [Acidobacteria bacterium]|nr:hypothetical protein [Acidobacteriota bacterium]MBI3423452.1 hypothetical protein [Acidobacteriota bacterium]
MLKYSRGVVGLLCLASCVGWAAFNTGTAQAQREPEETTPKQQWTPEKLAAEKWLLHEWHEQQLAALPDDERQRLAADIILQDVSDISVIQNSNLIARQPNNFDLNGRTLNFAPAGRGYVISNVGLAFDNNLGSKLDLVAAPAVNPKPGAQPGDDAYVGQDLGFSFPLFGDGYTIVAIASNGSLTFRNAGAVTEGFNLASVASETLIDLRTGPPRLAPYWHDLDGRPASTPGTNGVYFRRETDRAVITWNNIRDFPNDPQRDKGVQRFQVIIFRDGRISFNYDTVQLTSKALVGLTPGAAFNSPVSVNFSSIPASVFSSAIAEFFTLDPGIDELAVAKTFLQNHANRDAYDFIYVMTDFYYDLSGAQAAYLPVRNEVSGIGLNTFDNDPNGALGARRIQGIISLSNISALYPDSPVARFLGAYNVCGVLAQQTGQRWLAAARTTGSDAKVLLGRDEANWSTFFNTESGMSSPAARRSSVMEGNYWEEISGGRYMSNSLADGYSQLDQYLMGLRPANQVGDSFVLTNLTSNGGVDRAFGVRAGIVVTGTRQPVTVNDIVAANGGRSPDVNAARKNFRAAFVLVTRSAQASTETITKINRLRLAFESYFAQATNYLGSINTGIAEQPTSRVIAAASAASFKTVVAPGEIVALFGADLAGGRFSAQTQPLPTTLTGVQLLVDGIPAPLFFVSPGQINFQVPRTVAATTLSPGFNSATALLEVLRDNQLIRLGTVQVAPVTPGLFTVKANGAGEVSAVDALRGTAGPFEAKQANGQPNVLAVFGTGLGLDGTDVSGDQAGSVRVSFDGVAGNVLYAGRAPGFVGLNQFNVQFPANIASGARTMVITRNGLPSQAVTVTIR